MPEYVIPSIRRTDWVPGTNVGVTGGSDRFRPGGANERTNLLNVVTTYGADPTGGVSAHTAILNALAASVAEDVVYIPYGLFKITSPISTGINRRSVTIRGAGSPVPSSTNASMSLGANSFTVPAGQGWTPGIGIRIWRRTRPTTFMQGTVTSYAGTTLEVNITSLNSNDPSGPYTDWFVGRTVLINQQGAGSVFSVGIANDNAIFSDHTTNTIPLLTAPAVRGADQITVTSAAFATLNTLIVIRVEDEQDETEIQAGAYPVVNVKGFVYNRSQVSRVTNIAGNTLTIDPPLFFDCPLRLNPRATAFSFYTEYMGIESMAITSYDLDSAQQHVSISQAVNCWCYDVNMANVFNYFSGINGSLKCEIRKCWVYQNTRGPGTNSYGIACSNATANLFEDNVVGYCQPAFMINGQSTANAFLYNFVGPSGTIPSESFGSTFNLNHNGPFPILNLYEGNQFSEIKSDGYYGGSGYDSIFRNYIYGYANLGQAYVALRRFCRGANVIGNVVGITGSITSSMGYGQPNIVTGAFNGRALPSSGDYWLHWKVYGTLISRTGDYAGTLALNLPAIGSDFETGANFLGNAPWVTLMWNGVAGRTNNMRFTVSGSNLVLFSDGLTGGTVLPDVGTVVRIFPGQDGYQEWDDDVSGTIIQVGNFLVTGSGGAQESLGGDFLPNSLAYTARPSWWPSSITWPGVNPTSPVFSYATTPAGYRFMNGEDAPDNAVATPTFSPPGGQYDAAQSVAISCATADATIHYTTDGSVPTTSSPVYIDSSPLSVTTTTTLRAIAVKPALENSPVGTAAYTLRVRPPVLSPTSGTATSPTTIPVTITCPTAGATIRYTTSGVVPTSTTGTIIASGGIVTLSAVGTTTLQAIAYNSTIPASTVASGSYTISAGTGPAARTKIKTDRFPQKVKRY